MKNTVILFLLSTLMACAGNRVRPDYHQFIVEQQLQPINRVQQFRFTGWQPLNTDHLILLGVQNKAYLLELMSPCQDLPFAQHIALKQTSRTTLVAKFDKVLVQDQIPESCSIDKIYELSKDQHKLLTDFSGGHIKASKAIQ